MALELDLALDLAMKLPLQEAITLGMVLMKLSPKIKRRPYLGTGSGFVTQNGLVKVNSTRSESKKGQTLLNNKSILLVEGT